MNRFDRVAARTSRVIGTDAEPAPLRGARVRLRPPRVGDWRLLDTLSETPTSDGSAVWTARKRVFKEWSRELARQRPSEAGGWVIHHRVSDTGVGLLMYAAAGDRLREAVLTVGVAADQRGRRYAREAVAAGAAHLFGVVGFESLVAEIALTNLASLRTFEGLGFTAPAEAPPVPVSFAPLARRLRLTAAAFAGLNGEHRS